MKRCKAWFAYFAAIALTVVFFSIFQTAHAEEIDSEDWTIRPLTTDTAEIIHYRGPEHSVVIPKYISGYKITSIGENAFYYCDSPTSITIPNSVTAIGESAFCHCESLTSITIPNSVTTIGESAFAFCESLTSITIPNSVTAIGKNAFELCYNLKNITIGRIISKHPLGELMEEYWESEALKYKIQKITILDGVTAIGNYAFQHCYNVTSIKIPDSVTSIGEYAFKYCHGLTSITIPNGVTSIGDGAFNFCSKLTSVMIPNSVTTIKDKVFADCKSLTSIKIPDGITSIGDGAFSGCESLTNITLPNSVTTIGKWAFDRCGFTTIPDGVTTIEEGMFSNCSKFTSITIPNGVTGIGDYAFSGCESLTSITIPNSVTGIGDYAFDCCSKLTSIMIPNSVTTIGEWAFHHCTSLTNITLPNSVTSIGDYAFKFCQSLTSITIPNSVTSIGLAAFDNCEKLTIYYQGSKSKWNRVTEHAYVPYYVKVVFLKGGGTTSPPTSTTNLPSGSTGSGEMTSSTGEPTFTLPPVEKQPVVMTDEETGIKIGAAEGVLPSDTSLVVKPSNFVLTDAAGKFTAFDISLESGGAKIQPNGKVQVSIPIPAGYDKTRLTIYCIADDGAKTELPSSVNGNTITFETNHFSTYVVAEKAVAHKIGNHSQLDEKTGGNPVAWIVLGIVLVAVAGGGFALWWFKLRKKSPTNPE